MKLKYEIEATNIQGSLAHDFVGKKFNSMASALRAFDAAYSRKGFRIVIVGHDGYDNNSYTFKIVKSTFR